MSSEAVGWVFARSPMKGTAFAVHLAIADSANDQHDNEFWMSVANLATKARCGRDAARKALRSLEDAELLEALEERTGRTTRYRLHLPDVPRVLAAPTPRQKREVPRAAAATHPAPDPRLTQEGTQGDPNGTPAADAAPVVDELAARRDRNAKKICDRVWESKTPRPATKYVAALQIAKRLLEAGHRAAAIEAAMMAAPTITVAAMEMQLARGAPPKPAAAPVTSDRDAPSGRLDL